MHYLDFLRSLHELHVPQTYLEIGVRNGDSLALSRCRSVGIDPAFTLTAELDGDYSVLRTTSDDFFAQPEPLRSTCGRPLDLTFIDGLHLIEYSLRDFIHAERHSSEGGVIVFDDVFPRSPDEAARERHTNFWTGDVYKMLAVLARYRPDLTVLTVDTQPTGLALVVGLDPANFTLDDNYADILAAVQTPDPQDVPDEILRRRDVLDAHRVLGSPIWTILREARAEANQASADLSSRLRDAATGLIRGGVPDERAAAPGPSAVAGGIAMLANHRFRAEDVSVASSVRGTLLSLPIAEWPAPPDELAGQLRLGSLLIPARITAESGVAVLQAWVSGLPGAYPLGLRFDDLDIDCRMQLVVGSAGEVHVVDVPVSMPDATRPPVEAAPLPASGLRAAASRMPGLRPLVRALRRVIARRR